MGAFYRDWQLSDEHPHGNLVLKIYGFPTQNNGCAKYRVWEPLRIVQEQGLAEVDREEDEPQPISIDRAAAIFDWADVVYCQPFSEIWAACIFLAARDEKKKKLIVDLDDNIWAVHPMNVGTVNGELTYLKAHFASKFKDCWELISIKEEQLSEYVHRIDGTVVKNDDGSYQFLHNKKPDVKLAAEFLLRGADAVTTTNEVLANVIRNHTDKPVFVVPNYLDLRKWRKANLPSEEIWIGWCGSVSHYPDLKSLMPVFDRLMQKYHNLRVQVMGSSFDYLFPLKDPGKRIPIAGYGVTDMFYADLKDSGERWPGRMSFHGPVPAQQYEEWMCSNWKSHIGIAPLESNDFNDAKSELKWLEYTALGVPTVASDFGPYKRAIRDGFDGITTNLWESVLGGLIEDQKNRQSLVDAATERLHQEYNIGKRATDWMEVFECVVSSQVEAASSVPT